MKSQKLPTLQECLDAPAYSAVTRSIFQIEPESSSKLYITPPPQGRKKPADPRFACLGYIQKLKGIPSTAKAVLTWLVMERQWRTDRLIIVSFQLVADHFGLSRRQVIRIFQILEESGCLRIVKKGGSIRGSKREANTYALGLLFDALPPKETKPRPVTKMSLVPQVPLVTKMSDDQCQECHPLPIVSPYKNTHTESKRETSSPDRSLFTLENWLYRGKTEFSGWDDRDLMGSYESSLRNGVNGTWKLYQDKCYARRFNACPDSPRSSPAPRPAVKSSCESPKQAYPDYNDPKILEEALFVALSNGETPNCILAGVKDPALAQSVLAKATARLESTRNRSRMA